MLTRRYIKKHFRKYLVANLLTMAAVYAPFMNASSQQEDPLAFEDSPLAAQQDSALAQSDYPDQFNAAEQALMQGFNRQDSQTQPTVRHNFPSPAQIREVAAVKPASQGPTIRRIKSADAPNILDSIPVAEPEQFDSEAAPDLPVEVPARQKTATQRVEKQATSATAKKAPTNNVKQSILQEKITASELRARELERQLRETISQLAAAELEISRLSSIVQNNSRARLKLPQSASVNEVKAPPAPPAAKPAAAPAARIVLEKVSDTAADLHVATIAVEKADLRLGPGKNHSALMTLRRGSRLAIEARQGEWYRVFAPNGQRAWIHSSLVRFGQGSASLNDGSSVTMRGFDGSLR
jgi:hypothetical protein